VKVEREIQIAAPPDAVYDLITDASRLADWVTIHQGIEGKVPAELEEGAQLTQCLKLAGRGFKVRWTVVESRRPHRLAWDGRGPVRSHARVVNALTPKDGGTLFSYTNEYDLPGGPLGRMAGPMVQRVTGGELEESLRRLKALVE
jgi:carbon monoxide dehydrogenase subunit G